MNQQTDAPPLRTPARLVALALTDPAAALPTRAELDAMSPAELDLAAAILREFNEATAAAAKVGKDV